MLGSEVTEIDAFVDYRVFADDSMPWDLACPSCRSALAPTQANEARCVPCAVTYSRVGGIWRALAKDREWVLQDFVSQYEALRTAEGRRVDDGNELRALPFPSVSGKRRDEWRMRSRTYEALLRRVVQPLEESRPTPLRILDLGAGLGWLSYRLSLRGHEVAAVDLVINDFDGLGAHRHYRADFLVVQAEVDRLPFPSRSVDLVIYNASLHYSPDFAVTLAEGLRMLAPHGQLVIMDSPIYRDASSGRAMLSERKGALERRYGFRGHALDGEGFLTFDRLATLQDELALSSTILAPWYGIRWSLRPWTARLLRRREPARFAMIVCRRQVE